MPSKTNRAIPGISVIMPVYNGERYLKEAVDSILNQTFSTYEFIIIDDGSSDKTAEIIRSFKDPRIMPVTHRKNLGLTKTLNEAFDMARGDYIVRMDADDMSLPNRIEEQVRFMDNNPDISISGCQMRYFGSEAKPESEEDNRFPTSVGAVGSGMLLANQIAHETTIIRKKDIAAKKLPYVERYRYENEYDFHVGTIMAGLKTANIPQSLYNKRIHPDQMSSFSESRVRGTEMTRIQKVYFSFLVKKLRFVDPRYLPSITRYVARRCKNALLFRYRKAVLRKRAWDFYRVPFEACFHADCDAQDLKERDILDIATVAFNNGETIRWQIELIKKNLRAPYSYTVFDNSNDIRASGNIRDLCTTEHVAYVKLPKNPLTRSSSHGASLNWIYKNYFKKRGADFFGFLDHDIFPTQKTDIISILKGQPIYGHLQERGDFWYLWAGFCFFRSDAVEQKPDFMDGALRGVGVDTGGMNWGAIYSKLDRKKLIFPSSRYEKFRESVAPSQKGGDLSLDNVEHIGDWVHIFSSSGWKKMRGQSERNEKIQSIIEDLLRA